MVSVLPLSENQFTASVFAWIFRNFARVRSDPVLGIKVMISLLLVASFWQTSLFSGCLVSSSFGKLYIASIYFPYVSKSFAGLSMYSVPIPCPTSYCVKRYCASFGT
jgi:hypothetical protein